MRSSPEHDEQVALFAWAELAKAKYPALALLHAVPNWAGVKSPAEGARRKREGVKAGVPDIHLPVTRNAYIGLWIEMKAPGEYPRPNQREWIAALRAEGHRVEVCRSMAEARAVIEDYLQNRRALAG